jgi:putative PIN family toxin of toxin-antitoxin system
VIRAVLDANTIVSGLARFRHGTSPPVVILRAWLDERFELWISDELIDEVTRTLAKRWFLQRVEPGVRQAVIAALANAAHRVSLTVAVTGVATHPEDDLVLAAAVSAGADYLVTGDRGLQQLVRFRGVEIVSPRAFQAILEADAASRQGPADREE